MAQQLKEKLERLHELDDRSASLWNKWAVVQIDMLSQTPSYGSWYKDCVFITGSVKEGAFYARMFLHGKHINEGDYMFSVGNIQDPIHQLQPIEHAPGYFSIRSNGILKCFYNGVREKFLAEINSDPRRERNDFLANSSVLNMTENMFSSTSTKSRAYEFLVDSLLQPQVPCKATVTFERSGPSVTTTVLLTSAEEHLAECQVDTVPCFKLSSWPHDWGFDEFRDRNRKWPSDPQIVERIQDMVHIVPKSSPKLKEESERECCWRLSFSKAEIHLKSLFSVEENRVFLLFKILFYANIKKIERNGKIMASYFCKTTMLWMMEEEGAELCKNDLLEAIRMLFRKLKQFLDSDSGLPNFFYPSINLLEGYPQDLIIECSTIAENISERPLAYLPSNFDKVHEYLETHVKRLEEIQIENYVDTLGDYVKERSHLIGCEAFEVFWYRMNPRNWCIRFLFHPFVRAMIRARARRSLFAVRNIFIFSILCSIYCICLW